MGDWAGLWQGSKSGAAVLGNALKRFLQSGLLSCCSSSLRQALFLFCTVVVLNASGIKRLCCGPCSIAFALTSSSLFVWIIVFPGVGCASTCVCALTCGVYIEHSCQQAILVGSALAQTCCCSCTPEQCAFPHGWERWSLLQAFNSAWVKLMAAFQLQEETVAIT